MRNVNTLYQKKVDLLKDRVAGKITTKKFNDLLDQELIATHESTGISKEMLVNRMLQMDPKSNHYTG
jgi:hypothetical protein